MALWWECLPPTNVAWFNSWTRRHMWVEFVVGPHPCPEGFSPGTLVFLPPQKPAFPNSNWFWKQWTNSHSVNVPLKFPFIYFYFICYLLSPPLEVRGVARLIDPPFEA